MRYLNWANGSCDFDCIMVMSLNFFLLTVSWVLGKEGSYLLPNLVNREGVEWGSFCFWPEIHAQMKQSEQVRGMNFMTIWCMFRFCVRMLWRYKNETSSLLATWWLVWFFCFQNTLCYTVYIFPCFVHHWMCWVFPFSTEVTLLWNLENHFETCFLPLFCSPKLLLTPGKFQYHFPVKAKFDADMSKSRMEQHTPELTQPCFKLEVTQKTLLYTKW